MTTSTHGLAKTHSLLSRIGKLAGEGQFEQLPELNSELERLVSQAKKVERDPLAFPEAGPEPAWWTEVRQFVTSIEQVAFFEPSLPPQPEWTLVDNRLTAQMIRAEELEQPPMINRHVAAQMTAQNAAYTAAVNTVLSKGQGLVWAACDAGRDAMWAAWSIVSQRVEASEGYLRWHKLHGFSDQRWPIWQAGYGLYCPMYQDEHIVYRQP